MAKSKTNQKQLARTLYTENKLTQHEVAELVGVSITTVSRWAKKENWNKIKASRTIGKSNTLTRFYDQINEINTDIESRPAGKRYANSKEADTLIKLTTAIEKLEGETPFHNTLDVMNDLLRWTIENVGLKETKKYISMVFKPYVDEQSSKHGIN